jgi:hypothetical protein
MRAFGGLIYNDWGEDGKKKALTSRKVLVVYSL